MTKSAASARGVCPPGQSLTNKFPVLTYGPNAKFNATAWDFRLFGSVDGEPMIQSKVGGRP